MKGFIGKILKIDLSSKEITEEPLNEDYAKNFLGGMGYGCRYLYDYIERDTDPLSPENILMFMTGPLSGSNAPSTGKFVVCAKSPYTGYYGYANCGGFFGPALRNAGYDGIIIRGASDKPVYLEITENSSEIKDASHLWGKGIIETSKNLKESSGSEMTRVACIGQAGENLVKYAMIESEDKAAGRTGMGAVMGSKKLKAITIRAKRRSYEPADPDGFKDAVNIAREKVESSYGTQMFKALGTAGVLDMYNASGELPIKYWTLGTWEDAGKISGATASETIYSNNYPCFGCSIACAKKAIVKEGEYKTDGEVESPEYETIVSFGSMILNDNLASTVRANILCNDYGVDTISCGSTIAFIYYLYNNGKITSQDIDGLEPKWGDVKPALEMIKKIAFREGIGDVLAEGSDAVGKKFDISQDEIATVYGMEVPYHDLRSSYGMAVAYALGTPRGPCHCSCDMYYVLLGLVLEEYGINFIDKYQDDEDMAISSARTQDYRTLFNSLILCVWASNPLPSMIADLVKTSMGIECDVEKLRILGERIYMITRLFNLKMGLTPAEDRLPKILLNPVNEGGSAGKTPDFQKLKKLYYEYRTFDPTTGYPNEETLKRLGLDNL